MQKRPAKNEKSKGLQQEAADMETKLMELRKAMEAERARRETIMAGAANGSLWRNGASGLLRTNFRAKQGGPAPTAAGGAKAASTSEPSSRGPSASSSRPDVAGAAGPARAASGGASTPPPTHPGKAPNSAGSAAPPPRLPPPAVVGSAPRKPAPADVLSVHRDPPGRASPGGGGGGMSCGTDDNDDLAAGAFNEGDSHRSFLEALNEWRAAQRGGAAVPAAEAAGSSRPQAHGGTQASHSQPGASMEVQTEVSAKPLLQPRSSSKKSYFTKLTISTASRQAGESASGGTISAEPSQRDVQASPGPASNSSSSQQQPRASPRPPSGRAAAACAEPERASGAPPQLQAEASSIEQRLAMLDRLEQLERQQQAELQKMAAAEDGSKEIVVTTQTAMLVKGVHLPDAVLLPE